MKRILLPFLLFSSTLFAHPEQRLVIHPQANVSYYCQPRETTQHCIQVACSYATQYGCRIIARNNNTYYIETYLPPDIYVQPPVIVQSSTSCLFPFLISWNFVDNPRPVRYYRPTTVRHRPRRR